MILIRDYWQAVGEKSHCLETLWKG